MRTAAIAIMMTMLASGCATKVHFTAKNPEAFSQDVRLEILNPHGQTEKTLAPGVVLPHSVKLAELFSVEKGGAYRVSSAVPGSATIFAEKRKVAGGRSEVWESTELRHQAGTFLDDPQAIYALTVAFKKICPDAGIYPMELESALKSKLKGLVLLDRAGMREIMALTPEQLGAGGVSRRDITFPATRASGEVTISGSALAEVGRKLPLYPSFRFRTESDAIYRMEWLFEGAGATALPSANEDLLAAFDRLSDTVKSQMSDILARHREAAAYYLNQGYLAKLVRISLQKGRLLREGEEARAGDIITSKGVHRFERGTKDVREYRDVVLSFYGDELSVKAVPKATTRRSAVATGGALQGVTFDIAGYPTGTRKTILPETLRIAPATVITRSE